MMNERMRSSIYYEEVAGSNEFGKFYDPNVPEPNFMA